MVAMTKMMRAILYATVFLTGAAVLIIEVTAVRLLSPHFGSSLYVFSSVLTVILGALSIGYYAGGKLSDRLPTHQPLYAIIAFGGLAILVSMCLALRTLPVGGEIFSVATGPLLFSFLLFFLPALLLGIDSPYVIKLQSLHTPPEEMGRVVGATFFWSTLGSITGSLLTGFVLVPFLGVKLTVTATAIVLIVLGICGSLIFSKVGTERDHTLFELIKKQFAIFFVIIVASLVLLGILRVTPIGFTHSGEVLYRADGLYSQLLVYETTHRGKPIRVLLQDTNNSSAIYLNSYDLLFGYAQFAGFYPDLKPDTERFLMLGAGSFTIPRSLVAHDPNLSVVVSDLEPSLLGLAKTYFDLKDISRIESHIVDSRVLLQKSDSTYDVIFGDVFSTDLSIPAHLTSREFFYELKKDLVPEGIFMLNYIGSLDQSAPSLTGSLVRTIREVFPNLKIYALNRPNPAERQNIVFVARNGKLPIELDYRLVRLTNGILVTVKELEVPLDNFDLANEYVLTDDHSPIEYLMLSQLN